jgi:hypothetical protein
VARAGDRVRHLGRDPAVQRPAALGVHALDGAGHERMGEAHPVADHHGPGGSARRSPSEFPTTAQTSDGDGSGTAATTASASRADAGSPSMRSATSSRRLPGSRGGSASPTEARRSSIAYSGLPPDSSSI